MEYEERKGLLSNSRHLIQQAQDVRSVYSFGQIPSELRSRLSKLLDVLERSTSDRALWRTLADVTADSDEYAAHALRYVGVAPWERLLESGGYVSPPPPSADELAAAMAMNVRHALEENHGLAPRAYQDQVLHARERLQLHLRILRSRLDLTSYGIRPEELPQLARVATETALDTASALALPSIVQDSGYIADAVAGGGLSIVTSLLARVGERTWQVFSENRELRRPVTKRARQDPILQLLALMLDTAQELRTLRLLRFEEPQSRRDLEVRLRRQVSWMDDLLKTLHEELPRWYAIKDLIGTAEYSQFGHAIDPDVMNPLVSLLEDSFDTRSADGG